MIALLCILAVVLMVGIVASAVYWGTAWKEPDEPDHGQIWSFIAGGDLIRVRNRPAEEGTVIVEGLSGARKGDIWREPPAMFKQRYRFRMPSRNQP